MKANAQQPHFSKTGLCRAFLSASDAAAYDAGYAAFKQRPRGAVPPQDTPAWRGFKDAEQHQLDINEARALLARGAAA